MEKWTSSLENRWGIANAPGTEQAVRQKKLREKTRFHELQARAWKWEFDGSMKSRATQIWPKLFDISQKIYHPERATCMVLSRMSSDLLRVESIHGNNVKASPQTMAHPEPPRRISPARIQAEIKVSTSDVRHEFCADSNIVTSISQGETSGISRPSILRSTFFVCQLPLRPH